MANPEKNIIEINKYNGTYLSFNFILCIIVLILLRLFGKWTIINSKHAFFI
jgi:hypothetical protein